MIIEDFKADGQDTLEEKTNQQDVKLSTLINAVNVDGSEGDVYGIYLYEENLEQLNCELLDQDIAEVKLDELKKVGHRI